LRFIPIACGLAAVTVFLTAASGAAFEKTDRERDGLHGPVKSVKIWRTESERENGELVEGERIPVAEVAYNRDGYRTLVRQFTLSGGTFSERSVEYGKPGEISLEVIDHREPGESGTWSYNRIGNKATAVFTNPEGEVVQSRRMVEDQKGRIIDDRKFGAEGEEFYRIEATYEDSNLIETKRFEHGQYEGRVERKYDDEGRLVEEFRRDSFDSPYSRSVFEYNELGDVSRLREYRWVGAEQEETLFNDFRYTYEYDDHGNWVRRIDDVTYRAERGRMRDAVETAIREITYYEE